MPAKKVLIVDDSQTVRNHIAALFGNVGITTVLVEDGDDALMQLASHPDVALVISDVNMPNRGGLDLLSCIKEDQNFAKIPVLMLTTEGSTAMVQQAKLRGAAGWITKPFQERQLMELSQKFLGVSFEGGGELVNLAVGQFKTNLERYGVSFNILQPVVCIGRGIRLFERGKNQAFAGWVGTRAKVYSYLVAQVAGEIDFSKETQGNAVARLVVF
jgi:two-component system chemotaxis response regulator CheY